MKTLLQLAQLSLVLSTGLSAQNITADLYSVPHSTYAGIASQFRLENLQVDGQSVYSGRAYLFCADLPGRSLDEDSKTYPRVINTLSVGTMDQMEVWNRFSNAQNQSLAKAQAHWLVDNYYSSYFLNPQNNSNARQYAFGNMLWEIFGDGGTADGINFSNGNIDRSKFAPGGSSDSPTLWGYMRTLANAVNNSGVDQNYVPTFEIKVALDSRADHQDYLMLAANPNLMTVPEPTVAGLAFIGSLLMVRRRRD